MLEGIRLTVTYGDVIALNRVDVTLGEGQITAVLGESGSGKTTLLRALAGLEPLQEGRVSLDGIDVTSTPTHERHIGLVFQDFALFPHLDVAGNVGYGITGGATDPRTLQALRRVGIEELSGRRIDQLSGGQAQRVALARTLVTEPRALLLDEPLGSLDPGIRRRVARQMIDVLGDARIPTAIVTHDPTEAFAFGERLIVLDHGRVVATGPPDVLWERPGSAGVARLLGHTGILEAEVRHGAAIVGELSIPLRSDVPDGRVTLLVKSARLGGSGSASADVAYSHYRGPRWTTGIRLGSGIVEVETDRRRSPDSPVTIEIDPSHVVVLDQELTE